MIKETCRLTYVRDDDSEKKHFMKSPIDDTIWASSYGSTARVQAAFDRFGPEYHQAIMATGVPMSAAEALLPHRDPDAQGIDLGCGSGVLGLALKNAGLHRPLDGIDLSPVMLDLARTTNSYRHLQRANLLLPQEWPVPSAPYDFAITVGLIGDYVPYYVALPRIVALLRPGAYLGFAVEQRSTPSRALEKLTVELGLIFLSEISLSVPEAQLAQQTYQYYVVRRGV